MVSIKTDLVMAVIHFIIKKLPLTDIDIIVIIYNKNIIITVSLPDFLAPLILCVFELLCLELLSANCAEKKNNQNVNYVFFQK